MAPLSDSAGGAPAGFRWALIFLVSFYLLGHSALFCLLIAVIGGVGVGLIVEWWRSKDEFVVKTPEPTDAQPTSLVEVAKARVEEGKKGLQQEISRIAREGFGTVFRHTANMRRRGRRTKRRRSGRRS